MPGWDPYLDLTSGVLRNRLGITDQTMLDAAEAELTGLAQARLSVEPLPGAYDLAHLREFHRTIFGDIYPWAGELRTVSIGKGGQLFCPPEQIEQRAGQIFLALTVRDHLQGLARNDFLDALAELLAALNHLHPFREGNGRTQRAFVAQLTRTTGRRLSWAALDRDANIAASRVANTGNLKPMRELLDALLTG